MIAEPQSERLREAAREDAAIVTWAWSRVEVTSAIERRAREGVLDRKQRREAMARFEELGDEWDEVVDLLAVRARTMLLLARHPLRAADAAQLGAALLVAEGDPPSLEFVCLDERLCEAAEREGLRVLEA